MFNYHHNYDYKRWKSHNVIVLILPELLNYWLVNPHGYNIICRMKKFANSSEGFDSEPNPTEGSLWQSIARTAGSGRAIEC